MAHYPSYQAQSMHLLKWLIGSRKNAVPSIGAPALRDAIAQLLNSKRTANLRASYVRSLKQYLNRFAKGREDRLVNTITVAHIEEWFASRDETPASKASNIGRLSSLFGFCYRRGWIKENPCDRLEKVRLESVTPMILTVEQVRLLLTQTASDKPVALAYLTLTLLGGVRPEETRGISWESVGPMASSVSIDAKWSKVRQRRIVRLEPSASAWLLEAKRLGSTLPVSHTTRRRYIRSFRDILGLPSWPHDILRHTAASYWLAKVEDTGYVSLMLGNSPSILLTHYHGLVHRPEAERFWAILPK